MNKISSEQLKKYFDFLISKFNYNLKEIKSYEYAIYAKFLSSSVGIYFIYEFRDAVPQIQFTKLNTEELTVRPGLYTIRDLYKDENFELQSFYLDEIILFKTGKEYKSYFRDVHTIDAAIKISAELIELHAKDFIMGNEDIYSKINIWFKSQVNSY